MSFKRTPELLSFLSTALADSDSDSDAQVTRDFVARTSPERCQLLADQARKVVEAPEFPLDELGSEANRWFGDADEGRAWLSQLQGILQGAAGAEEAVLVKDSNGAVLAEGDSVTVIKDLKVKGGSSDLKRGTLIRKIHLIGDPDNIECRVDGSTLVLKTCFLKKA